MGVAALAAACAGGQEVAPPASPTRFHAPSPAATPSSTATAPPSATPVPVAARVNGDVISVPEWVAETRRALRAADALGQNLSPADAGAQALAMLIERLLVAQAAREKGLFPSEATVAARLEALQAQRGGVEPWRAYLTDLGYTPEDFRRALALDIAAARMRDAVIAEVPTHGPQVKVRVIAASTQAEAEAVLQYLQTGKDFLTLVKQYHPGGQGDLGWFPRGALWTPEIEEAAFALEPGQYSGVVATERGFYLVYLEDRTEDRPFAPWALNLLQARAWQDFVARQRAQAQVDIQVTPEMPPLSGP